MSDETEEYRYLFLVRMPGNGFDHEPPHVDSFYQVTVPPGISGDQAKVMTVLNPDFCKKERNADGHALKGMTLRLRFNQDMYQSVCMVRTEFPITAEDLDAVVAAKYEDRTLKEWLDSAAIGA
jgi:hypothetical protein